MGCHPTALSGECDKNASHHATRRVGMSCLVRGFKIGIDIYLTIFQNVPNVRLVRFVRFVLNVQLRYYNHQKVKPSPNAA